MILLDTDALAVYNKPNNRGHMEKKYEEFDLTQYSDLYDVLASNNNLNKHYIWLALDTAAQLHKGQKRQAGDPYIGHVLRVANSCARKYKEGLYSASSIVVALLHDCVEDGHISFQGLEALGFHKSIIHSVGLLTIHEWANENYFQFTMRIINSDDEDAVCVKIDDIEDNSRDIKENKKMKSRADKYRFAKFLLQNKFEDLKSNQPKRGKLSGLMSWFRGLVKK